MRRQHHLVTIFQMLTDKIVEQRPFQNGTGAAINPKTAPRELRAALVVDHAAGFHKIHVVFCLGGHGHRLTPNRDDFVILFAARGDIVRGDIGKRGQERLLFSVHFLNQNVIFSDFFAQFAQRLC